MKGVISTDYLPKFEHFDAETIKEALQLLKTYGGKAAIISGGTDLLRVLKGRVHPAQPEVLINIKSICRPQLNYIEEDISGLKIGSAVTLHKIETNRIIRQKYSLLAQATHMSGIPQSRNMGTVGGNLAQHVRCCYYRASGNAFFCRRKGGDKCDAVDGDSRYHAILGAIKCFAVCPSGLAPALVALGATVKVSNISGDRVVPIEEFFTPLGSILKPDDIISEIQMPVPSPESRGTYIKLGVRNTFDIAIASVAVMVTIEDGFCSSARIVLGEVSPLPWRAVKAEEVLVGEKFSRDMAVEAAQLAIEGANPIRMNAYKLDVVKGIVERAILAMI